MSHWSDEYRTQINDCENRESQLSEWEQDFLQSLAEQLDRGRFPTPKQLETLDKIWDRATRNG